MDGPHRCGVGRTRAPCGQVPSAQRPTTAWGGVELRGRGRHTGQSVERVAAVPGVGRRGLECPAAVPGVGLRSVTRTRELLPFQRYKNFELFASKM